MLRKYLEITIPVLCIYKDAGQLTVSIAKKHNVIECYMFHIIKATLNFEVEVCLSAADP